MTRQKFIQNSSLIAASLLGSTRSLLAGDALTIQLIRNATITITHRGRTLLIDPLLSEKHFLDPIPWTNNNRNPTVDLPFSESEMEKVIENTDAVLLTHLHPDHWDIAAQQKIPKSKRIICQPEDVSILSAQGFTNLVSPMARDLFNLFTIIPVPARHGHGELAGKMAPACGYIIKSVKHTIYITGDTVWYEEVNKTISYYQPDIIVVNAGAAQFQFGEPITMTAEEVAMVIESSKPTGKVIVVHMEAINHCYLGRQELKAYLSKRGLMKNCLIPTDGASMEF